MFVRRDESILWKQGMAHGKVGEPDLDISNVTIVNIYEIVNSS